MLLKEIKEWVNNLSDKFLDYEVVNGEIGMLDGKYWYRLDKPITTLTVDEENKEIIFLNDTQDELNEKDLNQ